MVLSRLLPSLLLVYIFQSQFSLLVNFPLKCFDPELCEASAASEKSFIYLLCGGYYRSSFEAAIFLVIVVSCAELHSEIFIPSQ